MSRIALVIPNRDGGKYFAELLAGVELLTEWPDEVIIVDGRSSDGGWELAQEFARRNATRSRIRVESRAPRGIYDAWNQGITMATADWIHIVCSDDRVEPDAYAVIRARITKATGTDLETFDCAIIDAQGRGTGVVSRLSNLEALQPGMLECAHHRPALLEALLLVSLRSVMISFVGVVIPAPLAKRHAFVSDCGSSGDVEWLLHIAVNGAGVNYTPRMIGAWRSHGAGATLATSGADRAVVHQAIRRRHLAALLQLAEGRLDESQIRRLEQLAVGDSCIDIFDYFADAKRACGWARMGPLWRAVRIAAAGLPRHRGWSTMISKRSLIRHLQTVEAITLLSGTGLLERQLIGGGKS